MLPAEPREGEAVELAEVEAVAVLQVRGVFSPDGTRMRKTHPLKILRGRPAAKPFAREGRFRVVVEYDDGTRELTAFDAYEEGDSDTQAMTFGGFTVECRLKSDVGLSAVLVSDAAAEKVFAEWRGTDLPH